MSWFSGKKRFLNFLIPIILALVFFSLTSQTDRRATWYESAFLNLLAPLQWVVTSVTGFTGSMWDRYVALINVSDENKKLSADNASLKRKVIELEETKQENERLKSLLSYKESMPYPSVTARVIANDPRSEFKSITINRGFKDGIDILMPVIGPRGLVGRIGRVSAYMSQVLLITDPNSAVDVLIQRSRARAILVGKAWKTELKAGAYLSRLEYLRRVSDVSEDDIVVTSGFDQVYPPGIPIGTLHDIVGSYYGVFQEADVVPFEDFAQLEEVLVLLKPANKFIESGS